MSFLEKLKQTVSESFQASENPEELKMLKNIQEELLIAENMIKTKSEEDTSKYETLKAEHVKLIKNVPSGIPPDSNVVEPTDRSRYDQWKAGLTK